MDDSSFPHPSIGKMASREYAICVSTSKPTTSLTAGGGGGSMIILCPHTGSVLSSLRTGDNTASKSALGMSHLSAFPDSFSRSSGSLTLILSFGSGQKKDDTYGMLLSLRRAPLSPLLRWKCRLPESNLSAGLVVSRCGHYVVGGGNSGVCYIWSSLGGSLLRTVRAHYRSVTALAWSACGHYLVTGGGDGVVHTFSLMDLVDVETPDGKAISPLRTWSYHHLSVTALKALPGDRMATASDDCKVSIIELFSDSVVLTVQMPHSIHVLEYAGGRLFAGAVQGSIYTIDLEVYAMHQTSQLGVTVKRPNIDQTSEDQVFGNEHDTNLSYKSELHGHSKKITSLAVMKGDISDLLVSGDEVGTLRVWDLESRSCIRIMEPWSQSVQHTTSVAASVKKTTASTTTNSGSHPVTAILVVPRGDDTADQQSSLGDFGASNKSKTTQNSVVNLVTPLQKFKQNIPEADQEGSIIWTPVPFLEPIRDGAAMKLREMSRRTNFEVMGTKRRKVFPEQEDTIPIDNESGNRDDKPYTQEDAGDKIDDHEAISELEEQKQEVVRLQAELEEAKSTIQRWEKVNNKLVAKLNQASSTEEQ